MDRLDEMKQQMELLRGKLDKQEIVSENLIRRVVKQKVHSLQREAAVKGAISLLCIQENQQASIYKSLTEPALCHQKSCPKDPATLRTFEEEDGETVPLQELPAATGCRFL